MKPTWEWLLTVLDSTEAQLKFGSTLSHVTDHSHSIGSIHSQHIRSVRDRNRDDHTNRSIGAIHHLASGLVDSRRRGRFATAGTYHPSRSNGDIQGYSRRSARNSSFGK